MSASITRSLALVVFCGLLGSGGALAGSRHAAAAGITVFAGSSLTTVLPLIDPGNTYSFGSSTTLGTQIENGAPADVLMAANTTVPASLYAAGVVEKPVDFVRNTLAVIVPKSNPARIKSIYDLIRPGITIDEAASSVPVGSYTVQVLTQMGLNAQIQANVVSKETSDAGVVAKVALDQVDAGFVYLSDYVIDRNELKLIKVPAWAQPKITYAMAIVAKSPNQAAARAFTAKVLSPAGQAILVKGGFTTVRAPGPTIAKVSPAHARVGATVTLTGTNFTGTTSVTVRGVPARFKIHSATRLTLTVPATAKSGTITVTNPAGTATSKPFRVG